MDAKQVLVEYKGKFDIHLNSFLELKKKEYSQSPDFIQEFVETVAEFTLRGGKRLRPTLLCETYKIFSEENVEEIEKLSVFIELIQSFLLIHDDIMDRAHLRRGLPTVHKKYMEYSKKKGFNDDKHFGETIAILCGDMAMQFAIEIISTANIPAETKLKAIEHTVKYISEVIVGQVDDVFLSYRKTYTEEEVLRVHDLKTATYTYKMPMQIGAMLAGASQEQIDIILKYAKPAGIAFQIRDDILGAFGNDSKTGKETKTDFVEGKKTLLIIKAMQKADEPAQKYIADTLGKSDLTDEEAENLRIIIRDTGSLDYSIKQSEDYGNTAVSALGGLSQWQNLNQEPLHFLTDLADYITKRNK